MLEEMRAGETIGAGNKDRLHRLPPSDRPVRARFGPEKSRVNGSYRQFGTYDFDF